MDNIQLKTAYPGSKIRTEDNSCSAAAASEFG
jgi:hypothetical protein